MAAVAAGKYDEGIDELKAAYAIKPHPAVLYNIAKALQDAGRVQEALDYYKQYLALEPPDAETVGAVAAKLRESVAKPEPEPNKPEPNKPEPVKAGMDEATARRMEELLSRLDAAVARAESLPRTGPAEPRSSAPGPAGAGTGASAEDLGQAKDEAYEEVVVTASRFAQNALTAPASVSVITAEEIQLSGATTLVEVLRRVPGIDVMRLGVSSSDVSIRGFNQRVSNKLLVLVDGRSVYEDFLGLTFFEEVPIELEEIERVEIIRGPGSALYGANAFVGVINIITRRPGSGPSMQFRGGAGSGKSGDARFVATQRLGRFAYRASAGYSRSDKWSVDFAPDRSDYVSQWKDPHLAFQSARANGVVSVQLARGAEASAAAGVNQLYTEIYPLGLLRNYVLDGVHVYTQAQVNAGPVRIRTFWNHLEAEAGPQYFPVGERSLDSHLVSNVIDGDAQLDQAFQLGGEHHLNLGVGYRLKSTRWDYLADKPTESHFSAFVQEEYRPVKVVSVTASLRADRHPLLGFNVSPRGAVVVTPAEGQAIHAEVGTAFREPTLVESYTHILVPVPGQPSIYGITEGNRDLKPERVFHLEAGYRGEFSLVQLDAAAYRSQVSNLIVLSALSPLPAGQQRDPQGGYYAGRSQFENDLPVYTAYGAELGAKVTPVDQLQVRATVAVERIGADLGDRASCGSCNELPAVKLYAGVSYRTPFKLDLNVDASWVSATTWIEREPSAADPSQIAFVANPLAAYAVVNARAAYRFLDDHLEVGLVGSNLAGSHQEHPFGNSVETRVMGTLGGSL
jgi:iron complex outermembrane receptor protein